MSKVNKARPEKLDANELLLISVRINDLRSLKMRLTGSNHIVKLTCGQNYTTVTNTISSINMLLSEMEVEKKRLKKRSWILLSRLIKRSKKLFEESPKKMVPLHSKDILNGYIELTEVSDDEPVPYLLLLESGKIEPADSVRAKEVMSSGPNYENEYTNKKIRSHAIMTRVWPS